MGMFLCRIGAGITTGTLAILSAQPTDVVKVRMQAETKLAGEPSRYKGVVDAYLTIGKSEGIKGLYKGKTFCYVMSRQVQIRTVQFFSPGTVAVRVE